LPESVLYYKLTEEEQSTIPTKWSAPEVLSQGLYYMKSDCFSFGVVLWELFSGAKRPYVCFFLFFISFFCFVN